MQGLISVKITATDPFWVHNSFATFKGQFYFVADDLSSYLVAASSLAVDAGVLTCHNLHIIRGDGDTGGPIITGKAAEIVEHELNTNMD